MLSTAGVACLVPKRLSQHILYVCAVKKLTRPKKYCMCIYPYIFNTNPLFYGAKETRVTLYVRKHSTSVTIKFYTRRFTSPFTYSLVRRFITKDTKWLNIDMYLEIWLRMCTFRSVTSIANRSILSHSPIQIWMVYL